MSEKVTVKVERSVLHLPAIALRGLVVFPNNLLHFEVGREKSIAAVEWAVSNNSDVFLVSGGTAGFLSLCGGLLSLLVMWVLYYKLPFQPTWFILSVCGALAHNIGQLLGAGLILSSAMSLYYAPVMLVLGLIMGALTSLTLKAILPALGRLGYNTREKR